MYSRTLAQASTIAVGSVPETFDGELCAPRELLPWHQAAGSRTLWTAAGMLEAERQFRKIVGYRDLGTLVRAIGRDLDRRHEPRTTTKEAAIVLSV